MNRRGTSLAVPDWRRPANTTQVVLAVIAITALTSVACAGTHPPRHTLSLHDPVQQGDPHAHTTTAQGPPTTLASTAPADRNDLPEVTVIDVVSGESLVLASLAPADRPILVWTYEPH